MNIKTTGWPIHTEEELEAVRKVLSSGCTNYWTGSECRQFEIEYAHSIGTKYAVALMNGTVALEAALYALNIGPGDEVITSCRTFIASASCIIMRGAIPILADIDIHSQNITVETIKPCITTRTKAIIVVHLAGWPADMEAILELAKKYNLKIIEDCAQAHGAILNHRMVGSWGDIAAFSFCQDKIITTGGEGGMITTNDKHLWQKIWSFKDHGKNFEKVHQTHTTNEFRWLHDSFGTNWRMTEMQAAIGRIQLKNLSEWINIRNRNAKILSDKFEHLSSLRVTLPTKNITHAYYKYYIFVRLEKLKTGWDRNRIIKEMNAKGMPCFSGICSEIYREKAFQAHHIKSIIPKEIAQHLAHTSLMLLVHPTLTEQDMTKMANTLMKIILMATKNEMY